jgi:chemotaxis protein CheX
MTEQMQQLEEWTCYALQQVFQNMMSMDMKPDAGAPTSLPAEATGQIMGSVGFIGDPTGVIYLIAGLRFARLVTGRMLGIPESETIDDSMVNDAIGELSNMVVGQVKSRLCDAGWACTLTIPTVVRGQQLSIESSAHFSSKTIVLRNGNDCLLAELVLKKSQK